MVEINKKPESLRDKAYNFSSISKKNEKLVKCLLPRAPVDSRGTDRTKNRNKITTKLSICVRLIKVSCLKNKKP